MGMMKGKIKNKNFVYFFRGIIVGDFLYEIGSYLISFDMQLTKRTRRRNIYLLVLTLDTHMHMTLSLVILLPF